LQKLMNIFDVPPIRIYIAISLFYGVLIFGVKNSKPVYGDSGLMYLQTKQIADSGFSTFQFDYKGSIYDKEVRYAPYKTPFLGKVQESYYVDFPPYFPLLNSGFYKIFGFRGLYIVPFLSFAASLFFLAKIGSILKFTRYQTNFLLIIYSFCTTVHLYNFIYHEYPIAISIYIVSLYFLLDSFLEGERHIFNFMSFGFFAGLSLFFRLELIFIFLSLGLSFLIFKRIHAFKMITFSLAGFAFPFLFLLMLNSHIHGHPLGLRYSLTIDNSDFSLLEKFRIVKMTLFSPLRGIFFQSPFALAAIVLFFIKKKKNPIENFLFFSITFSFILILATAPNDGDHIAPRYLFGTFSLFSILLASQIFELKKFPLQKILGIIVSLTIVISTFFLFKNIRWLAKSDKNIISFNAKLEKIPEKIIIFQEYASPLNLQNSYSDRIFYVAEEEKDLGLLVGLLVTNKVESFVIAENIINPRNSKNGFNLNSLEDSKISQGNQRRVERISKTQDFPFIFHHFRILKE